MCLSTQNALSTKAFVAKISGFGKFELDLKLSCDHFCTLVNSICSQDTSFSEDKFNEVMDVFEKAFAEGATPPYAGDLENETYKAILSAIRDFNTSELSTK